MPPIELKQKKRLKSINKKNNYMPLRKASSKSKKSVQKAVSYNIAELTRANKTKPAGEKRSRAQIAAIGFNAARGGKKRK
jgi:hypothetical protein